MKVLLTAGMTIAICLMIFLVAAQLSPPAAETPGTPTPGMPSPGKQTPAVECYEHAVAWTSGQMNIRSGPSTQSPKARVTRVGERLQVYESVQIEDYCWLRVNTGEWMAKTGLVSSTEYVAPVAKQDPAPQVDAPAPASAAPDHVVNSAGRRIPLHDHADFRRAIAAGFYYVRDILGQPWWDYIEIIDDVRFSTDHCSRGYACMYDRYKVVYFGARHSLNPRLIASTLIHEACHMWQVRENRHHGRDYGIPYEDRPWEHECQAKEREAGF